jgi:hypothetical protein
MFGQGKKRKDTTGSSEKALCFRNHCCDNFSASYLKKRNKGNCSQRVFSESENFIDSEKRILAPHSSVRESRSETKAELLYY